MAESCRICMKWIISLTALNTIHMLITLELYAHVSFLNSKLVYPTARSAFSFEYISLPHIPTKPAPLWVFPAELMDTRQCCSSQN